MLRFKAVGDVTRFNLSSLICRSKLSSTAAPVIRQKHKVPQKRASSLLNQLKIDEFEKLRKGRQWPEIRAGDSVAVDKLPFITSNEPVTVKGLVIAKTNRASDTAITLLNVEHGTPVVRRIIMYSPLIQNIRVLQKAFIHKGKKRVRRSKLYYMLEKDPENYTVK